MWRRRRSPEGKTPVSGDAAGGDPAAGGRITSAGLRIAGGDVRQTARSPPRPAIFHYMAYFFVHSFAVSSYLFPADAQRGAGAGWCAQRACCRGEAGGGRREAGGGRREAGGEWRAAGRRQRRPQPRRVTAAREAFPTSSSARGRGRAWWGEGAYGLPCRCARSRARAGRPDSDRSAASRWTGSPWTS
jgi:hypothetical protein